jgi:hypothetical protein
MGMNERRSGRLGRLEAAVDGQRAADGKRTDRGGWDLSALRAIVSLRKPRYRQFFSKPPRIPRQGLGFHT